MRHFNSICPLGGAVFSFLSLICGLAFPLCLHADVFQTNTGQEGAPPITQPIQPLKDSGFSPDVHITWLGQSCFAFHSFKGNSLLTDPYNPDIGYPPPVIDTRVVTISNEHPDHNYLPAVSGAPIVIRSVGETATGGLIFQGIRSWHDNVKGKKLGPNRIFKWNMGGLRFVHLGDLGQHRLTAAQLKAIGMVDVLLIPVGGVATINGTQALEIVKQLQPKMVIPMHYKTDALKIKLDTIDNFLKGPYTVVNTGKSDLLLNSSSLPAKPTIFVMDYVHKNPTAGGTH
jgi:L-ascorbate metabolism protein UlaG (beta-lactamase superfamily)